MSVRYRKLLLFSILLILILAAVPVSVKAGSIIGTKFMISQDDAEEIYPAVAYNSERQEYLVVWWFFDLDNGNYNIRAQRLTKDGAMISDPYFITTGGNVVNRDPDITYNRVHDQYLVVWQRSDPSGKSICGRLLSGAGELLGEGDIVIQASAPNYDHREPKVAYAYTDDSYMVVWTQQEISSPDIYTIKAQAVTHTGALGLLTLVSNSDSEYKGYPDIAYNRHMNRHLVVWEAYDTTLNVDVIIGQQIHGDGGTYLGEINFPELSIYDCRNPTVAAIPTAPDMAKFVLAFEKSFDADSDIYGIYLDEDECRPFAFFEFGHSTRDDLYPAVAGNEVSQEYFLIWREEITVMTGIIKGVVLDSSASELGTNYEFLGLNTHNPVVTDGHLSDFLLIWHDSFYAADDHYIFGQLFGNRGYLPLISK